MKKKSKLKKILLWLIFILDIILLLLTYLVPYIARSLAENGAEINTLTLYILRMSKLLTDNNTVFIGVHAFVIITFIFLLVQILGKKKNSN